MAKQILIGIEEQNLNEVAHYLMIYFPYNEEMCSYTDTWMDELYENEYPLVSKGIWSGIINLAVCICKPRYVIVGPISCLTKTKRQYAKLQIMFLTG